MKFFKKIGLFVVNLFKNHTILAILLTTAIVLTSVWTPIIIKLVNDNKKENLQSSLVNSNNMGSGPSVFDAGQNNSQSSLNNTASENSSETIGNNSQQNGYSVDGSVVQGGFNSPATDLSQNDNVDSSEYQSNKNENNSNSSQSNINSSTQNNITHNNSNLNNNTQNIVQSDNSSNSSNKVESGTGSNNNNEQENNSSNTTSKPEIIEKKKVICWGDSITQGMSMTKEQTYPSVLNTYLGEDFEVLNAGVPGESSIAIAARQGAVEVFTAREVVIKKGELSAYLGTKGDTGICTADGKNVDIDERGYAFSCQLPATVVYIDGVKYRLGVTNEEFFISVYSKAKNDIVIKKGSKIEFNCAREQQNAYCEVILVGANDGLAGSPEDIKGLTERYKKMIERRGNDKYIVVVPYWLGNLFDEAFEKEFGDKAVNFRKIALTTGLQLVGLEPSQQDQFYMKQGTMPPTLMVGGGTTDPLHLSKYGYKLLALLVYERGLALGYW